MYVYMCVTHEVFSLFIHHDRQIVYLASYLDVIGG